MPECDVSSWPEAIVAVAVCAAVAFIFWVLFRD